MSHEPASPRAPVRRIGLELEFAGLSEARAARVFAEATGGSARQVGEREWACETGPFGTCRFFLDTAYDEEIVETGGKPAEKIMRQLVPVELATDPFDPADLPQFDQAVAQLREAGAVGSRNGLLLGFGLHLNVDIASRETGYLAAVLTSYALLEAWFRRAAPIDISRRLMPFVAPYPDSFIDTLALLDPVDLEELTEFYLRQVPSRNFGLDLLPVLADSAPETVASAVEGKPVKPRPAFHFRLPDCRIDEPDWSVMEAYDQWTMVEAVAADPDLMRRLRETRVAWASRPGLTRRPWFDVVEDVLLQPDRQAVLW
ncbi:amidoligase family protein [Cribrihabitans sp. XS_ASV171]